MHRTIATAFAGLIASTLLLVPAAHAADDLCVPEGNPSPQWWNAALSPAQKEARWDDADVRVLSTGPYTARVRSIWKPSQETVYFEFKVHNDRALHPDDDVVLLALGDETGTMPELFIRFAPVKDCGIVASCDGEGTALTGTAVLFSEASTAGTSITWSKLSTTNPSADFVVEHPWVVVEPVGSAYDWTLSFALQVPVDGSGEIWPDLRIYGNTVMRQSGLTSSTDFEFPLLCTSSSMTSNDCLIYSAPGATVPDDLPIGNMVDSWPVLESGVCI